MPFLVSSRKACQSYGLNTMQSCIVYTQTHHLTDLGTGMYACVHFCLQTGAPFVMLCACGLVLGCGCKISILKSRLLAV